MKKIYLVTPMRGRTAEEIKAYRKKQKAVVEVVLGEEVEVIDSYIEGKPPVDNNEAIWYLGESIKKMSYADMVAFPCWKVCDAFKGCRIEKVISEKYGIPKIEICELPEDREFIDVIDKNLMPCNG